MSDYPHDNAEFIGDELELLLSKLPSGSLKEELQDLANRAFELAQNLRQEHFYNAQDITIRDEYDGFVIILENVEGERVMRVRIDHEDENRKALVKLFERIDRRLCVYYEEDY